MSMAKTRHDDATSTASDTRAATPAPSARSRVASALSLRRLNAVYLLTFFVVLYTALNPGVFMTSATMVVVFNSGVVTCFLALAFLLPLTTETYDLSVGSMMCFSLMVIAQLSTTTSLPPVALALIAVAACAVAGAVNGYIVVKLHVNSFIATLGTSQVLLAGVLLMSNNRQVVADLPLYWSKIGQGKVLGIPNVLIMLLVVAAVMWYLLEYTRLGRYLFATGGNADAARLSGVPTNRLVWGSLIGSATLAGLAGVIYSMQVGVASSTVGIGLLFPAATAVFLGAAQLSQRPNVWGTLIAYFALAFGVYGLRLTVGAGAAWASPMFEGIALIVAVAIASRPLRARLRDADNTTRAAEVS